MHIHIIVTNILNNNNFVCIMHSKMLYLIIKHSSYNYFLFQDGEINRVENDKFSSYTSAK